MDAYKPIPPPPSLLIIPPIPTYTTARADGVTFGLLYMLITATAQTYRVSPCQPP